MAKSIPGRPPKITPEEMRWIAMAECYEFGGEVIAQGAQLVQLLAAVAAHLGGSFPIVRHHQSTIGFECLLGETLSSARAIFLDRPIMCSS